MAPRSKAVASIESSDSGSGYSAGPGTGGGRLDSTASLLAQARAGDERAEERLLGRYMPILRRWAHGRLPGYARGLVDTDDLVQVTLLRAFQHLGEFEPRREATFLAYLRRILLNSIRDEIRRTTRRPAKMELPEALATDLPSAVEQAIGRETMQTYETALSSLPEEHQEAIILRIELGFSYREIAQALGRPSANAARMMVSRAVVRLAELMSEPQS